ncbi:aldo/keto reductase [Protaetiibacter larvae]|uniref:Aldo/keto reductase n=1 Tax=Protaetiibacter larvae TaxID=2592654 RepID=A0A5C1YC76_9MICO|nr:aldo/keto reductase [Protaetiibacter larvae]
MTTHPAPRDLAISRLGLGAAQFGNLYRETDLETTRDAVAAAWDAGIRYFDTAPHYGLGLSEERLGEVLRDYPREEYLVSTKVGRLIVPSPETADRQDDQGFAVPADRRREWDFSRDGVWRSLDESLTRLGLDHVDIAYLHDPDDHWEAASTTGVQALVELREQGVVRAIGAGMNQSAMLAEFVRRGELDLVMLAGRLTLLDPDALDELIPLTVQHGVGVIAVGVYNSGILSTDRPTPDAHFNYAPASRELIERAGRIAEVCERHGVSLPAAAVAYPLRAPSVVSVVLGMRTAEQVRENVARATQEIPEELWTELAELGLATDPAGRA